ncbi:MAG: metallopeptidase TldD-related protein [Thermoanaerobaculia bacterium]|nr:metallopeptidase TldD-related protein [Thermoanaerobaculia bacterium]
MRYAARGMYGKSFESKSRVDAMIDRVLEASVADETELVWFERRHGRASWPPRDNDGLERPRLSVLLRVVEGGRPGWHRTEARTQGELENAVRAALAVATTQERARRRPVLPTTTGHIELPTKLFDRAVARLDVEGARERLREWLGTSDAEIPGSCRLSWSETRLLVANNHGVRRATNSTELDLDVHTGSAPGCGRASASARTFEQLEAEQLVARARRLCAYSDSSSEHADDGEPLEPEIRPEQPLVLAPEATAQLLDLLNMFALAGRAYLDGSSLLTRHRGVQVFDRAVHVYDDGRRSPGVPFPFDLEGSPKVACDLIVDGKPSTPALNQQQGAEAGLTPTAQSVGGRDALFGNLFLAPGELSDAELWSAARGGMFVGWIDPPECLEPTQLRFRTVARSIRRITDDGLGAPVSDQIWETSLPSALGRLSGLGQDAVIRTVASTPLGAVSAPAVVLPRADGFSPVK